MGGRGASGNIGGGKILTKTQLANMTWAQVRKANTDFLIKHSVWDMHSEEDERLGYKGKYDSSKYQSNGAGGAILKTDAARMITKEEYNAARKAARR